MTTTTSPQGGVTLRCASDLMPNFQASTTVSVFHPIHAVHDTRGNPAIFSIGSDHQLWVTFQDRAAPTGWRQVVLTDGLPAGTQVSAFDTTQVFDGEFAIAIATAPASGGSNSDVYYTGWLSNDFTSFTDTDWCGFSGEWNLRTAEIPNDPDAPASGSQALSGAVATGVLMGNQGTADKPAAIIVVTDEGSDANHYFVNADTTSSDWSWAVYPLPENPDQILDIAFGYLPAGPGVFGSYVLYEIGGTTELYFVGAVAPVLDQAEYNLKLEVDPAATCLGVLADTTVPHYSNLYVGGNNGVDVYPYHTQTLGKALGGGIGTRIVPIGSEQNISQLALAQDSDSVAIWMLDAATQKLWYVTGAQGAAPGAWTAAIALQEHVAHICALRQPSRRANQLISATSDNRLGYQWQDPATTLWRATDIPLGDAGAARQFPSYTSTLHFEDAAQNAMANMEVALTSSQWGYVTVNGYVWELSPDTPVTTTTDSGGNLTIVAPTVTLGTPVYHARPKPETDAHNINPADNAIQRLAAVQSAQDLLDQFPDMDPDAAELGAKTLSTLTQYMASLPDDGSNADGSQPISPLPDQLWGGDMSSGSLAVYNDNAEVLLATAPPSTQLFMRTAQLDVVDTLESAAGDVLHAMEAGIEAIGEFVFAVAEGVVRFAVKIAGQWFHFLLASIGAVLELINWVIYQLLGIDLEKILKWLGFLFEWDDIVDTHKVFTNIAHQSMDMLCNKLPDVQARIDQVFNQILAKTDSLGQHPLMAADSPYASVQIRDVATSTSSDAANSDGVNSALYSAGGSFASYQALHGGILDGPAPEYGSGDDTIRNFVDNTLIPQLQKMTQEIETAFQTLMADYQAGTLTVGEVVGVVTKTLVETVVEIVQVIVDGLFTVADTLLSTLDSLLFDEIDIPLLTSLYEWLTDNSKMSLVDGLSLLAAIPSTIFYKTVAGEAPFANGSQGLDSADSFAEILAILNGGAAAKTTTMAVRTTQLDVTDVDIGTVYSQAGGSVVILTGFINSFINMGQALTENQLKFASKLAMGTQLLYMAGSIPFNQDDDLQQGLSDLVYLGNVIDTLIQGAMFFSPRATEPEEIALKGGYDLLKAIGELIAYVVSFVDKLEIADQQGDDTEWIIETFVQNILVVIATATGAIGAVAGDENPEVELPAFAITGGLQFLIATLGLVRAVDTIENDIRYFVD